MRNLTTVPSLPMVMQRTPSQSEWDAKERSEFRRGCPGRKGGAERPLPYHPGNTYGISPLTTTGNPETINNTRSQTVATR